MSEVEIWLVRHGESVSNAAGIWQGQGDSPLSDRGRQQVDALSARLRDVHFDVAISSDLVRAADTSKAFGATVERDAQWREIDVGAWEGLTMPEVVERFPDQIDALKARRTFKVGGGESWPELFERADRALSSFRAVLKPGQRGIVFSHGAVIASLMAGLANARQRWPWPLGRMRNTAVSIVRFAAPSETSLHLAAPSETSSVHLAAAPSETSSARFAAPSETSSVRVHAHNDDTHLSPTLRTQHPLREDQAVVEVIATEPDASDSDALASAREVWSILSATRGASEVGAPLLVSADTFQQVGQQLLDGTSNSSPTHGTPATGRPPKDAADSADTSPTGSAHQTDSLTTDSSDPPLQADRVAPLKMGTPSVGSRMDILRTGDTELLLSLKNG